MLSIPSGTATGPPAALQTAAALSSAAPVALCPALCFSLHVLMHEQRMYAEVRSQAEVTFLANATSPGRTTSELAGLGIGNSVLRFAKQRLQGVATIPLPDTTAYLSFGKSAIEHDWLGRHSLMVCQICRTGLAIRNPAENRTRNYPSALVLGKFSALSFGSKPSDFFFLARFFLLEITPFRIAIYMY